VSVYLSSLRPRTANEDSESGQTAQTVRHRDRADIICKNAETINLDGHPMLILNLDEGKTVSHRRSASPQIATGNDELKHLEKKSLIIWL